ncbi:MAG: PKD domain-containing protein [Myxococcaceae bacterium]
MRSERALALRLLPAALIMGLSLGCRCGSNPGATDTTPPVLTLRSPEVDSFTTSTHPVIVLAASDVPGEDESVSGVSTATLRLSVNGVDVSEQVEAVVSDEETRFTYVPVESTPLLDGPVMLSASVADAAGNQTELAAGFQVDTRPPEVVAVTPGADGGIATPSESLVLRVTDEGSGVDWTSLGVSVDERPVQLSLQGDTLTLTPPSGGWPGGGVELRVTVADVVQNISESDLSYGLPGLVASPIAVPRTGDGPLTVRFSPYARTRSAVERYEWDFEGDGTFDRNESIGATQSFTFTRPGAYDARLRLTDTHGAQTTGTVRIVVTNAPPTVTAEATPSNGAPPLTVDFVATATDTDGIARYEWDALGDGSYDPALENTPSPRFRYTTPGTYQVRLRVTDRLGASTEFAGPTIQIRIGDNFPSVNATATPASGEAPLDVAFSASYTDAQGRSATSWSWDFDGNGTFDFSSSASANTSHAYRVPGAYDARARVVLSDGTASTEVVHVSIRPGISLRVPVDTLDVTLNESGTIESTLRGDLRMSLVIERPDGALARTLVPWVLRATGTYTDAWNGTDEAGARVPEGAYRAVLLYALNDRTLRFDLGSSTGGTQYFPVRSALSPTFSPFAGEPMRVSYVLPRTSDVSAFIGLNGVNTRLVTLLGRVPQGAGSHTLTWNAENAQGRLIDPPPGDAFLLGLLAFTAPDNALFVRSGVHASAVSASPGIFEPGANPNGPGNATSTVSFELNRWGGAELSVFSVDSGALVFRRTYGGRPAGRQTLTWDGRGTRGESLSPGGYRVGVAGVAEDGTRSMAVFTLQRIYY